MFFHTEINLNVTPHKLALRKVRIVIICTGDIGDIGDITKICMTKLTNLTNFLKFLHETFETLRLYLYCTCILLVLYCPPGVLLSPFYTFYLVPITLFLFCFFLPQKGTSCFRNLHDKLGKVDKVANFTWSFFQLHLYSLFQYVKDQLRFPAF